MPHATSVGAKRRQHSCTARDPIGGIGCDGRSNVAGTSLRAKPGPAVPGTVAGGAGTDREIWYLVFDRFGSERSLRAMYDIDLGPFLDGLRERGFIVGPGVAVRAAGHAGHAVRRACRSLRSAAPAASVTPVRRRPPRVPREPEFGGSEAPPTFVQGSRPDPRNRL